MKDFSICDKRSSIIASNGHLLIEGGPGSGKTTIALLKTQKVIADAELLSNQKILFLSFARATISRIEDQAKNLLKKESFKQLEINTYHGFTWSLIQAFGYLACSQRTLRLVTPPNAAALMTKIPLEEHEKFQRDLFSTKGLLCFDLFAELAGNILMNSKKIRGLVSNCYPVIIVDEFQDTNNAEWELVKQLGINSNIVALADLQQRIYDFRGASITRIPEFNTHFGGTRYDLGKENYRSGGTDIADFGDDLLTGANIGRLYKQVIINRYRRNFQDNFAPLKYELLNSIRRLKQSVAGNKWSIAILVKSKHATLSVSTALSQSSKGLPSIFHEVLIDPSGPALSAGVIASLLEPTTTQEKSFQRILAGIITHIRGRKSDGASQADIKLIDALERYTQTGEITGKKRLLLISEIKGIVEKREKLTFKGNPADDWLAIRHLFETCSHENLTNVYADAFYLRLLNKGAILNEELSQTWRNSQNYQEAGRIVEAALVQEHFSMANRKWQGIFVMTIHKSKGKEFDEVVIWEDQFRTILHANASALDVERTKLALRVAVTRARTRTTILTCKDRPCSLI